MTPVIPKVSTAALLGHEGDEARHAACADVATAAAGPGFLALAGADAALGLDPQARARLLRFFDLPPAARAALARAKFRPGAPNHYRGVFLPQPGEPTWKEGIDLGPDLVDPALARPGDPLTEPTPLPPEAEAPGWRAEAAACHAAMSRLGLTLVEALAAPFGLDPAETRALFDGGLSTLRLIRYPERTRESLPADLAQAQVPGEDRWIVGKAHCDNGFVTLLWQDAQGGLQARAADGAWIDVPPLPGGLAVNFGRMLSDITGGQVRATEHRVLGGLRERVSIPFFLEPAADAAIPFADGPRPYGDVLWERMTRFVEFRGVARRVAAD
ncbi:MAG: 2OG-Fe(II) oxygenase family protein [Pseudomonadota bacterium]